MYKANELILLQVLAVGLLLLSITSTPRLFPACVRPPDTGIATGFPFRHILQHVF